MNLATVKKVLRILWALFLVAGCLAFFLALIFLPWCFVLLFSYGGSAASGYQQAGSYFLMWHGKETQVSRAVFERLLFVEGMTITSILAVGVAAVGMLLSDFRATRKIAGWSSQA